MIAVWTNSSAAIISRASAQHTERLTNSSLPWGLALRAELRARFMHRRPPIQLSPCTVDSGTSVKTDVSTATKFLILLHSLDQTTASNVFGFAPTTAACWPAWRHVFLSSRILVPTGPVRTW